MRVVDGNLEIKTQTRWDAEAGVWFVSACEIPGVTTEAPTREELSEKLAVILVEMINLNGLPAHIREQISGSVVPIELLIQSEQRLQISC